MIMMAIQQLTTLLKYEATAEPKIEATKTATVTDNGDGYTGSGSDTIVYTITVSNTGGITLSQRNP